MYFKILGPTADRNYFEKELTRLLQAHKDVIDVKYSVSTIYPGENMHFYSAMVLFKGEVDNS